MRTAGWAHSIDGIAVVIPGTFRGAEPQRLFRSPLCAVQQPMRSKNLVGPSELRLENEENLRQGVPRSNSFGSTRRELNGTGSKEGGGRGQGGLSSEEGGRGRQRVTFMTAAPANVTSPFGASVSILSCNIVSSARLSPSPSARVGAVAAITILAAAFPARSSPLGGLNTSWGDGGALGARWAWLLLRCNRVGDQIWAPIDHLCFPGKHGRRQLGASALVHR